jgi:hypothetical protein
MRVRYDGIDWGWFDYPDGGRGDYQFYILWWPNWLGQENRYWGVQRYYYDGPHVSFGFWFFNVSWSAWRSLPPLEMMSEECQAKWLARPKALRWIMGL